MGNQTQTEDNRLAEAQALYEVRFMTEEDIPQVCHLEKTSFSQPWSEFAFHSELADNELAYYVVLVPKAAPEQAMAGCGLFWMKPILPISPLTPNIAASGWDIFWWPLCKNWPS